MNLNEYLEEGLFSLNTKRSVRIIFCIIPNIYGVKEDLMDLHESDTDLTVISLFCGCGGLDWGFKDAGFKVIWANDFNLHAVNSYQENFPDTLVIYKNIKDISIDEIPDADILIGGFPCQGFSLGGCRRKNDPRNTLYLEFSRILQGKRPKVFLAENVKGLLTMGGGSVINDIVEDFKKSGYNIYYRFYNAKQFGVPQDRERVFLVGIRDDLEINFKFPEPTFGPGTEQTYNTMRKEIWELRDNPGDIIKASFSSRYMSRQRKRGWDKVSYCIPASAKQVPLHPDGEKMQKKCKDLWVFQGDLNRRLSITECKVIQSFPNEFILKGPLQSQYNQIGNAVPPRLAAALAISIKKALLSNVDILEIQIPEYPTVNSTNRL